MWVSLSQPPRDDCGGWELPGVLRDISHTHTRGAHLHVALSSESPVKDGSQGSDSRLRASEQRSP